MVVVSKSGHALILNGISDGVIIPDSHFAHTGIQNERGHSSGPSVDNIALNTQTSTTGIGRLHTLTIEAWIRPDCGGVVLSKDGLFELKVGQIGEPGPAVLTAHMKNPHQNKTIIVSSAVKNTSTPRWEGTVFPRHGISAHGSYNSDASATIATGLNTGHRELLHVVGLMSSNKVALFVNGILMAQELLPTGDFGLEFSSSDIFIGGKGGEFRGAVESIHLSRGFDAQMLKPDPPIPSSQTVAIWRFEEPAHIHETIYQSGAETAAADGSTKSITIAATDAQSLIAAITGNPYDSASPNLDLTASPYSSGNYKVMDLVTNPASPTTILVPHTPYNILFNPDGLNLSTKKPNQKPPERLRLLGINGSSGALSVESIHLDFSIAGARRGLLHNKTANVDDHFVLITGDLLIDSGTGQPYQPPHYGSQVIDRTGQMVIDEGAHQYHGLIYSSRMATTTTDATNPYAAVWPAIDTKFQMGHTGRHILSIEEGHHYLRQFPKANNEIVHQSIDGTADMAEIYFDASYRGLENTVPINSRVDIFRESLMSQVGDINNSSWAFGLVDNGKAEGSGRELLAIGGTGSKTGIGQTIFDYTPFLLKGPIETPSMSHDFINYRKHHLRPISKSRIAILSVPSLNDASFVGAGNQIAPFVQIHYNAVDITGQSMGCKDSGVEIDNGGGYAAGTATSMTVSTVDIRTKFAVGDAVFTSNGDLLGVITAIPDATHFTIGAGTNVAVADNDNLFSINPFLLIEKTVPSADTVLNAVGPVTVYDAIAADLANAAKDTQLYAPGGLITLDTSNSDGELPHNIGLESLFQSDPEEGVHSEDELDESLTPQNYSLVHSSDVAKANPQLINTEHTTIAHDAVFHRLVINQHNIDLIDQLTESANFFRKNPSITGSGAGGYDTGNTSSASHLNETFDIIAARNIDGLPSKSKQFLIHPSNRSRFSQLTKLNTSINRPAEPNVVSIQYLMSKARATSISTQEGTSDRQVTMTCIGLIGDAGSKGIDVLGSGAPDSHVVKEVMPGAPVVTVTLGGPGQGAINTKPTYDPSPFTRLGWNTRKDCGAIITNIAATGGTVAWTVAPLNNATTDLASWGTYCFPTIGRIYLENGAHAAYNTKAGSSFTMDGTASGLASSGKYIKPDGTPADGYAEWLTACGLTANAKCNVKVFVDGSFGEDTVCNDGSTINDRMFQSMDSVTHDYQLGTQYASTRALVEIPVFPDLFFTNTERCINPGPDNSLKLHLDATYTAHNWLPSPVGKRCPSYAPRDRTAFGVSGHKISRKNSLKGAHVTGDPYVSGGDLRLPISNYTLFQNSTTSPTTLAGKNITTRYFKAFLANGEWATYTTSHSSGYLILVSGPTTDVNKDMSSNFLETLEPGMSIFPGPSLIDDNIMPIRDHPTVTSAAFEGRSEYYYNRSNVQTQGGNVDYGLRQYVSAIELRAGPRENPHLPKTKTKRARSKCVSWTAGTHLLIVEDGSDFPLGGACEAYDIGGTNQFNYRVAYIDTSGNEQTAHYDIMQVQGNNITLPSALRSAGWNPPAGVEIYVKDFHNITASRYPEIIEDIPLSNGWLNPYAAGGLREGDTIWMNMHYTNPHAVEGLFCKSRATFNEAKVHTMFNDGEGQFALNPRDSIPMENFLIGDTCLETAKNLVQHINQTVTKNFETLGRKSSVTHPNCSINHTSGLSDGTTTSTKHVLHSAAAAIVPGMLVSGTGIPDGAYITKKNTTTCFTLSVPVTVTNAHASLTFTTPVHAPVAFVDPYQATETFARVLLYDVSQDREFIAMQDLHMQVQSSAKTPVLGAPASFTVSGPAAFDGTPIPTNYSSELDVANGFPSQVKSHAPAAPSEFIESAYVHSAHWNQFSPAGMTTPFEHAINNNTQEDVSKFSCLNDYGHPRVQESACCPDVAIVTHKQAQGTDADTLESIYSTTFDTPMGTRVIPSFLCLKGIRNQPLDLSQYSDTKLQHLPQWTQMDFVRRLTVDLGEIGLKEGVTDIEAAVNEIVRLINQAGAPNGRTHARRPASQYPGETDRLDIDNLGPNPDVSHSDSDASAPHLSADFAATGSTHDPAPFWENSQSFASHDRGSHMGYVRAHVGRVVSDSDGNEGYTIVIHSTVPGASGRNFCVWLDNSKGQASYKPQFLIGHGGRFRNFWCRPDEMTLENMHPAPMPINKDGRPFAPISTLKEILPPEEMTDEFVNNLYLGKGVLADNAADAEGTLNANIIGVTGNQQNTVYNESYETQGSESVLIEGLRSGTPAMARINFGGMVMAGIPGWSPRAGPWGCGRGGDTRYLHAYGQTSVGGFAFVKYNTTTNGHVPTDEYADDNIGDSNLYGIKLTDHIGRTHIIRFIYSQFDEAFTNEKTALPPTIDQEICIWFDDRDAGQGGFTLGHHMVGEGDVCSKSALTVNDEFVGNKWGAYPSPFVGLGVTSSTAWDASNKKLTVVLAAPYDTSSTLTSHPDILGYMGFPDSGTLQYNGNSKSGVTLSYTSRSHNNENGPHIFYGVTGNGALAHNQAGNITSRINWTTLLTDEVIAAAVNFAINMEDPNSNSPNNTSFDCTEMYAADGKKLKEWGLTRNSIRVRAHSKTNKVTPLHCLFESTTMKDWGIHASTILAEHSTAETDEKRFPTGYLPATVLNLKTKYYGTNANTATPVIIDSANNVIDTTVWRDNLRGTRFIDTPGDLIIPKIDSPSVEIDGSTHATGYVETISGDGFWHILRPTSTGGFGERKKIWWNTKEWALVTGEITGTPRHRFIWAATAEQAISDNWETELTDLGTNDGLVYSHVDIEHANEFDGLRLTGNTGGEPLVYFRGARDSIDHEVPLYFGGGFSGVTLDINDGTQNDYSDFYTHPYANGPTGSAGLQNIGEKSTSHCLLDTHAMLAMFPGTPYLDDHKGRTNAPYFNQESILPSDLTAGGYVPPGGPAHAAADYQNGTRTGTTPVTVPSPLILRFSHPFARYDNIARQMTTFMIFGPGQAVPLNSGIGTEPHPGNLVSNGNLWNSTPTTTNITGGGLDVSYLPNLLCQSGGDSQSCQGEITKYWPPSKEYQRGNAVAWNYEMNWEPAQGMPNVISQDNTGAGGTRFGFDQEIHEGRYYGNHFKAPSTNSTSPPFSHPFSVADGGLPSLANKVIRKHGFRFHMDGGYHPGGHWLDKHTMKNPPQPVGAAVIPNTHSSVAGKPSPTAFRVGALLTEAYGGSSVFTDNEVVIVDATRVQNAEELATVLSCAINEFPGQGGLKSLGGTFLPSFQNAHKQDKYGWIPLAGINSSYAEGTSIPNGYVKAVNPAGGGSTAMPPIPRYGWIRTARGGNHGSIVGEYSAGATGTFATYVDVDTSVAGEVKFILGENGAGHMKFCEPISTTLVPPYANATTLNSELDHGIYVWAKTGNWIYNNGRATGNPISVGTSQDHMCHVHFNGFADAIDRTRPIGAIGWHGERYSYFNSLVLDNGAPVAATAVFAAGLGAWYSDLGFSPYGPITTCHSQAAKVRRSDTAMAFPTQCPTGLSARHLVAVTYESEMAIVAKAMQDGQTCGGDWLFKVQHTSPGALGTQPNTTAGTTRYGDIQNISRYTAPATGGPNVDAQFIKSQIIPFKAGAITSVAVTAGGSGYSAGTANVSGGSGTGASVTYTVSAGAVNAITAIANAGTGYQIGDVLTISGGGGNATITVSAGTGYTQPNPAIPHQWHSPMAASGDNELVLSTPCASPTGDLFWEETTVVGNWFHSDINNYRIKCDENAEANFNAVEDDSDPLGYWKERSAGRNFNIEHVVWKRMDGGNLTMPASNARGLGAVPWLWRANAGNTPIKTGEKIYGNCRFSFETTNSAMFPIIQAQELSHPQLNEQHPFELRNILMIPNEDLQFESIEVTDDTGQTHTIEGGSPLGTIIRDFQHISDRTSEGLSPTLANSGLSPNMKIQLPHPDTIPGNIVVRSGFDRIQSYQNETIGSGGMMHPAQPEQGVKDMFAEPDSALGPRTWPTWENKGWEHISQDADNISIEAGKTRLAFPDTHSQGWTDHTDDNPLETAYEQHDRTLFFHITKMGHTSTSREAANTSTNNVFYSQTINYSTHSVAGSTLTASANIDANIFSLASERATSDNRWFARIEDSTGQGVVFSYTGVSSANFTGVKFEPNFETFIAGLTETAVIKPSYYIPAGSTRFYAARRLRDHCEVSGNSPDMNKMNWFTALSDPTAFAEEVLPTIHMTPMPIPRMGHHYITPTMSFMPGHFTHPFYEAAFSAHHGCSNARFSPEESKYNQSDLVDAIHPINSYISVQNPLVWFSTPSSPHRPSDIHGGAFTLLTETKVAYDGYGIAASVGDAGAENALGRHILYLEAASSYSLKSHFPDPMEVGAYQIVIQPNVHKQQLQGFHNNHGTATKGPDESGTKAVELTGQQVNLVVGISHDPGLRIGGATDGSIALLLAEATMADTRGCEIFINEVMLDFSPDSGEQFTNIPPLGLYNPLGVNENTSPAFSRKSLPYRPGTFDRATPGYTLTVPWWAILHRERPPETGASANTTAGFRHLEWHKPDDYYQFCRATYGAVGAQITLAGYPSLYADTYAPHQNLRSLNPHCKVLSASLDSGSGVGGVGTITVDNNEGFPVYSYYGEVLEYIDYLGNKQTATYATRDGHLGSNLTNGPTRFTTVTALTNQFWTNIVTVNKMKDGIIRLSRPYNNFATGDIFTKSKSSAIARVLPQTLQGSRDTNSLHTADSYLCLWHPNLGRPYTFYSDNSSRAFQVYAAPDSAVDKKGYNAVPEHFETIHYNDFLYSISKGPFAFHMKAQDPEGKGTPYDMTGILTGSVSAGGASHAGTDVVTLAVNSVPFAEEAKIRVDAVSTGAVTAFTITDAGAGYNVGDVLSQTATTGSGSGFKLLVTAIGAFPSTKVPQGDATRQYAGFWPGGSRGGPGASRLDGYGYIKAGWGDNDFGMDCSPYGLDAFTDATCDTNHTSGLSDGSSTSVRHITHDANSLIVAGLAVSGAGIPAGATIASINNATCFTLSADTTATNTNTTLTFGIAGGIKRKTHAALLAAADNLHGRQFCFGYRFAVRPPFNRPRWALSVRGIDEAGGSASSPHLLAGYGHGPFTAQDNLTNGWKENAHASLGTADVTWNATTTGILERQTQASAMLHNDQLGKQVRYSEGRRITRPFGCPVRTIRNAATIRKKFPGDDLGKGIDELADAHRFYMIDWWGNTRGEDVRRFPARGFGIRPAWDPQDVYVHAGNAGNPQLANVNIFTSGYVGTWPSEQEGTLNSANQATLSPSDMKVDWYNPLSAQRVGDRGDGRGIRWPTVFNEGLLHEIDIPVLATGLVVSHNTAEPPFGTGYVRPSNTILSDTELPRGISSRLGIAEHGLLKPEANVSENIETLSGTFTTGGETLADPFSRAAPRIGLDADTVSELSGGKEVDHIGISTQAHSLHTDVEVGQRISIRGAIDSGDESVTLDDFDLTSLSFATNPTNSVVRVSNAHAMWSLGGTYILEAKSYAGTFNDAEWGEGSASSSSNPYQDSNHDPTTGSGVQTNRADKTIRFLMRPFRRLDNRHIELFRPKGMNTGPQVNNNGYRATAGGKYGLFNYDIPGARSGTISPTNPPYQPSYTFNTSGVISSTGPKIPGADVSTMGLATTVGRIIISENTLEHFRSDAPRRTAVKDDDSIVTRADYSIQPRHSQTLHPKGEAGTDNYNTGDHSTE